MVDIIVLVAQTQPYPNLMMAKHFILEVEALVLEKDSSRKIKNLRVALQMELLVLLRVMMLPQKLVQLV